MTGSHNHRGATPASRVAAVEAVLLRHGILQDGTVEQLVQTMADSFGPMNGAKVVARAWVDPDYRAHLLEDGTAAVAQFGISGLELGRLTVVENTPGVHNVVVCTLCSCYPWALLGLPPGWYKSLAYRSRMVREPRAVLVEMGVDLADGVEVRVWDSSAEVRYLVLPERPSGTDKLDESALAELVTRDAMVGVQRL